MFWLKARYYFASQNDFVVGGFAVVLTDGWPLPASSERLNERGAVIAGLQTPLPWKKKKKRGGAHQLDGELAMDNVLKWEKKNSKKNGPGKEGGRHVWWRLLLGAAHLTPFSQEETCREGSLHDVQRGLSAKRCSVPRYDKSFSNGEITVTVTHCDGEPRQRMRVEGLSLKRLRPHFTNVR